MGAKALELRATMSLARLRAQQGQRDEARTMLVEVYGWFTDTSAGPSAEGFGPQAGGLRSAEGFATVAVQEAKALLEELR